MQEGGTLEMVPIHKHPQGDLAKARSTRGSSCGASADKVVDQRKPQWPFRRGVVLSLVSAQLVGESRAWLQQGHVIPNIPGFLRMVSG